MASFNHVTSIYPILRTLASFVSTLDLFNLALTCRSNYQQIRASEKTFNALRRHCLCDGHGLAERQAFTGLYSLDNRSYVWGRNRKIWQDEPIEVRIYATTCPPEALPCIKCTINICEECRYYPREPPHSGYPVRRPHLNSPFQSDNVMCLCPTCDARQEEELRGKFLNELCDCDVFRRWICGKCKKEERSFVRKYYKEHTEMEEYGDEEDGGKTKNMGDHQHSRDFYCLCGKPVPQDTRPRCTWCKRRHLPEEEWHREWQEVGSKMPIFEEERDPCYSFFQGDTYDACSNPLYPKLPYDGPIWQVPA